MLVHFAEYVRELDINAGAPIRLKRDFLGKPGKKDNFHFFNIISGKLRFRIFFVWFGCC